MFLFINMCYWFNFILVSLPLSASSFDVLRFVPLENSKNINDSSSQYLIQSYKNSKRLPCGAILFNRDC